MLTISSQDSTTSDSMDIALLSYTPSTLTNSNSLFKVLGVLKKYVDGADGKIFHLCKLHWVALERISGTDKAIYFDDMVMMHMENYEGSVATLNIVQEMSPAQYDTVFSGSNKLADKVRQLHQKQTKVSNVLGEYW